MNWKEFLKPDWRRIVIFLVLTTIFFVDNFYSSMSRHPCPLPLCSNPISLPWRSCPVCSIRFSDYLSGIIYYAIYPSVLLYYFPSISSLTVILLAIQLIYFYFLSCLIIWIYDKKFKKVKKK